MALDSLPRGPAKRDAVREMFDRIAPRYDALNRLLTVGLDQRWRRRALDRIQLSPADRVVDLACGTGDLAELAAARGAQVLGVDFARGMLHGARRRAIAAHFVQADAAILPLAEASVDVVTCGFALRNFVSLPEVFEEIARVLRPGGRVALLDVDQPRGRLARAGHAFYFERVVPWIGGVLSDREAYAYLPRSVAYLPPRAELVDLLRGHGFDSVRHEVVLLGSVQLLTGVRRVS